MPKNSRQKGKRGELEAAKVFRHWGWDAKRGVQFKGTLDSPDIIVQGFPFHPEVKRTERFFGPEWLLKAEQEGQGTPPLVIWRPNNHPHYAFLKLDDLLALMAKCGMGKPIVDSGASLGPSEGF